MKRQMIRIDEEKCNGCGACVPSCKEGAIQIVNGKAKLVNESHCDGLGNCLGKCPMDAITIEEREAPAFSPPKLACGCPGTFAYKNTQWPVQLALIPVNAPYLKNADLILLADCTAIAYASLHKDFIRNRVVAIACPKLDDAEKYIDKLTSMIEANELRSLEVVMMEVPCCSGLGRIIDKALEISGSPLVVKKSYISVDGNIIPE